ncbi:DUF6193 family natural product biosynthesis protein [Kitasatospora camelliae]|uniref:DUF6193 family natural product biosynthesis protein n=1 Tax=Kitasatospora camelliae TaxID=3156397 RepID=A0AAU8K6D5_9ACTN
MISSTPNPDPNPNPDPPEPDGGLAASLNRTAARLGLALAAPAHPDQRRAEYADGDGSRVVVADLYRAPGYWMQCHRQGAWLAFGVAEDLAGVVTAAAAWMGGAGVERTRQAAPFIRFRDWALAHEREPLDPVELAWQHQLDWMHLSPDAYRPRARSLAMLEAAYADPRLRRLTPVFSHFTLRLSSTTTFPHVRVGGSIDPFHERHWYGVKDMRGHLVARTETPEEAVALVAAMLPHDTEQDTGPAR